jgi:enhancer of mRNA-decapping protein 4
MITSGPLGINLTNSTVLLTPDAFLNSPNTTNKSNETKIIMNNNNLNNRSRSSSLNSMIMTSSLSINKLNSETFTIHNWPQHNSTAKNSFEPSFHSLKVDHHEEQSNNNNNNNSEIKNLIIEMNKTLCLQRDEIESLRRSQLSQQHQLKSFIDTSLKQFLSKQQQQQMPSGNSNSTSSGSIELQQSVINNLLVILEKLIKDEINRLINAQFSQHLLEPIRAQICIDLNEKLKQFELVLKESALNLFISKPIMDTLSQSVTTSLHSQCVQTYRDTFQKILVPNFEKSCQNMYQQVNESFAKGTQDYLNEFEQLTKQQRKMFDENKEPILNQIKQFSEQIQLNSNQIASNIAINMQQNLDLNLRNTNAILQDTIISSVKAIIKEELHLAMRDQQQILSDRLIIQMKQNNGTITPIPSTSSLSSSLSIINNNNSLDIHQSDTLQYQITQHLKKGSINQAFQVALCAADLNLLENLCELVSPLQAFAPSSSSSSSSSKLQQPVILSLIQQLSQDLNSNTELKIKYLEEAIVNLDLTQPLTIEHTPIVMNQLVIKLQQYIQMHPNDKTTRQCKMLLMASKSLSNSKQNNHYHHNI